MGGGSVADTSVLAALLLASAVAAISGTGAAAAEATDAAGATAVVAGTWVESGVGPCDDAS